MNTFELLEKLSEKPKHEVKYALIALMLKDKIDFLDVSNSYVEYLRTIKEDRLNQLIEAETCVAESFHHKKGNKRSQLVRDKQRDCKI